MGIVVVKGNGAMLAIVKLIEAADGFLGECSATARQDAYRLSSSICADKPNAVVHTRVFVLYKIADHSS